MASSSSPRPIRASARSRSARTASAAADCAPAAQHLEPTPVASHGAALRLSVPTGFCLRRFVRQSAAPVLPPVEFDADAGVLHAVVYSGGAGDPAIDARIAQATAGAPLDIWVAAPPTAAAGPVLQAQVLTILGLDEDLSLFHAMATTDPGLAWAADHDAGRTLRSPRVFEDLLKSVLRARVAAAKLHDVCARFCQRYGMATAHGRRAFPTEDALAAHDPDQLAATLAIPRGLAGTVHALAQACTHGSLIPDSLRRLPNEFAAILQEEGGGDDPQGHMVTAVDARMEWQERIDGLLCRLPGFGDRACTHMLPLLGCHDMPMLDGATLRRFAARFPTRKTKQAAGPSGAQRGMHPDVQRVMRRVGRYSLYAGLAQRLLLTDAEPPTRD